MNKKGFTLIEMLIVIVLMGVIMTLAIPSVMNVMDNRLYDEMNAQEKLIKAAANLYKYRYRGEFNNNPGAKCFIVSYQTLLDEKLLDEQDIKCSGYIYYPGALKKDDTQQYFLNCSDTKGLKIEEFRETDIPTGCINLDVEQQDIEDNSITAPTITGGNNDWVSTDVEITVENSGIPLADVNHYDYLISIEGDTPSKYVEPTGSTQNSITISENGIHYIWYRVVDKSGNISDWSNRQIANIDKKTPLVPIITASDNIISGNLHTKNFVLIFGGGENESGNSYYYGTSTNPTTMATAVAITPEDNGKRIYVKSCSGANICSETKSYVINIEIPEVVDPALIE